MSDLFEHNPGDHEDPLAGPTWIIGFLGAVLLAVIGLGLTALYYNAQHKEEEAKIVKRDPLELEHLRAMQLAVIDAKPHWREEMEKVEGKNDEQKVRALSIPIDHAMELVVQESGKTKP